MMQSWKPGSRGTQVLKTFMNKYEGVCSVLIDDWSQSVFAGSSKSTLIQIDMRSQKIIKKYSKLGIGKIICLSSFNNLLYVGGNKYCFTLIYTRERRILIVEPVKTPILLMKSSQFSIINLNNYPRIALDVSGGKSFYIIVLIIYKSINIQLPKYVITRDTNIYTYYIRGI